MTTPAGVAAVANAAYGAGLCVIPPLENGTKAPDGSWKAYQSKRPTIAQMRAWYPGRHGVGIITGAVSGNLECFEFDDAAAHAAFLELAGPAGLGELVERIREGYSEATPNDGVHWFYLCDEIGGNTKLASRPKAPEEKTHPRDNVKTLIETRGEGGFVIIAPSHGPVHPSGRPYVASRGTIATIATITPAERMELHRLARSLDLMPPKGDTIASRPQEQKGRPGDDYNGRARWEDILEPAGWQRIYSREGVTHWRRPGKREGISATTNHAGSGLLYVFSSSTEFEAERGYSKFSAYSMLHHNDDYAAAAQRLNADGYGDVIPQRLLNEEHPRTDAGNAALLAQMFGARLRYYWDWKCWLVWTGHRWKRDPNGTVLRFALEVAHERRREAAEMEGEGAPARAAAKAAFSYALACEGVDKRNAMIDSARPHPALEVSGPVWDINPMLLGVENGVVDLATGLLQPGRPGDRITKTTGLSYDPEAQCPRWLRFLEEVFQGNREVIEFVHRAVGYSVTGDVSEQAWFLCYGSGGNGKSVFSDVIGRLLGEYAGDTPAKTIMKEGAYSGIPAEVAALAGLRFVTCSETDDAGAIDAARVKYITGGTPVSARFLHGNPFTFVPQLKLLVATNHLPKVDDDSDAYWRRVLLIPFLAKFDAATRERDLENRLLRELPGILAWAVRGAVEWRRSGLNAPLSVLLATNNYRNTSDPLGEFISARCMEGADLRATRGELWKAYKEWGMAAGYTERDILRVIPFGRRIDAKWPNVRGTGGVRWYQGVGLRASDDSNSGVNSDPFRFNSGVNEVDPQTLASENLAYSEFPKKAPFTPFTPLSQDAMEVNPPFAPCCSSCEGNCGDAWQAEDGSIHCEAHHNEEV